MKKTKILSVILLCPVAFFVVLPVVYTFTNSFMSASEITAQYFGANGYAAFDLIPNEFSLDGYYQILLRRPDYLIKFWNSLGYTLLMVVLQQLAICPAAYGFARFNFPGRNVLFFLVILMMMLPYQVTLVANYLVLDQMQLIGSWWAIILPATFSPMGVFILRQAMGSVPKELIEAARLDGANEIVVLLRVVLPRCKGAVASVVILSFVEYWNMVEQPLMFLTQRVQYPLSIFLAQANAEIPEVGFACGVLALLPVLLVYLFFEDELVEGITSVSH